MACSLKINFSPNISCFINVAVILGVCYLTLWPTNLFWNANYEFVN